MKPLLLALALLPTVAAAHETFLVAAGPARVGAPLALQLSSTARYPKAETPIQPARIVKRTAVIGTAVQNLLVGTPGPATLTLSVTPAKPGVLAVAIDLGPKPIALTAAKVDEYFAEVEASAAVRQAWASQPAPRQWREFYTKHAKAYVCVAPCGDTAAATTPIGQSLEFVAADTGLARFTLLADGKPLAGQPVQIVDGAGKVTRLASDGTGQLLVPATIARPLLLATTVLRPPARRGGEFTSDFATLWLGK